MVIFGFNDIIMEIKGAIDMCIYNINNNNNVMLIKDNTKIKFLFCKHILKYTVTQMLLSCPRRASIISLNQGYFPPFKFGYQRSSVNIWFVFFCIVCLVEIFI